MTNETIIKKISKLQILCIRYIERNNSLKVTPFVEIDRLITNGKSIVTYKEGIANLRKHIEKNCAKNSILIDDTLYLEREIKNSSIADLRFATNKENAFSELEHELKILFLEKTLFMLTQMASIKQTSQLFRLTETRLKQACQQNRLLNTQKLGNVWLVHLPECVSYFKLEVKDKNLLGY